MEKIIDIEKKGNIVRFYIGTEDDYWGDDWNDRPYEHNAGTVYDRYITRLIDVAFPFDAIVCEASDDYDNSPYSKDDMKNRDVPCLVIVPPETANEHYTWTPFQTFMASERAERFYFNDPVARIETCKLATIISNTRKEA